MGKVPSFRIPIADPDLWQPAIPLLQQALHFLSGDIWELDLLPDGPRQLKAQNRGRITVFAGHDCVSLFSGGMDSAIGALNLLAEQRCPLLITHSYRGDSEKQIVVRDHLPIEVSRFAAVAHPEKDLVRPRLLFDKLLKPFENSARTMTDIHALGHVFRVTHGGPVLIGKVS